MSLIRDINKAESGLKKIEWVASNMPVLSAIQERFKAETPLANKKISMSIHLEAKTAYLALTLAAGGAEVFVTGCNPLSTQDDVAAALAHKGFEVYAWHGASESEYNSHLIETLKCAPDIIIDDGGDLISLLHGEYEELGRNLIAGCEETTTGVNRLYARNKAGKLKHAMFAVNNANCKYLFDNRHGTGQSTWDAIMNTTNLLIAGKLVVVAGYGYCGKGIALRGRGLGANVIICEVNPFRALEAYADGYSVMTMDKAAELGDIFITATGCRDILTKQHFKRIKDGALLCNAGHFDVEINKHDLSALASEQFERKPNIRGYRMADGRIINLLGDGRLVNLAAGNGHPAEIMDLSFAIQALTVEYIAKHTGVISPDVYIVPKEIDEAVARAKLSTSGIKHDCLSEQQSEYLSTW